MQQIWTKDLGVRYLSKRETRNLKLNQDNE